LSKPASRPPRPWGRALAWLLFLGPFFFVSYGFATWVTSQRTDVGVIVFDWERHIPFLPWTIVPYWLIDGLYGLSLFLCATRVQLDTHAKRLLTAQVVAVACFLLFPLRFSFERPPVEGLFGTLFDLLGQFDKPFNQAPSLHIALMALLWVVYLRALPKAWHGLVHGTFALIGVSVLTTWQHHFIDVPTGLALGGLCLWLWPDDGPPPLAGARLTSDPSRRRLAGYYALGSVACVLLASLGGAALWLCWPAGALALVAAAYLALGPAAFQKRSDGTLSPAAFGLLAPYLLGAWLNARAWTRNLPPAVEIVPGLLLGRLPGGVDLDRLGVAAIVDVSAELPCPRAGLAYFNVPMLDLVAPSPDQLDAALHAIRAAQVQGPVLVCCALGFSRSALAVAAWLLAEGRAPGPEVAEAMIRRAKPAIVLGPAQRAALAGWWGKAP
jgi:membrane-associated phospholipid phosphatase